MIYLIRHGLDDESYVGGWSDVDLTKEGISQIRRSSDFIVSNNLPITKIVSSDIKRAYHTAKIINERIKVKLIVDSHLRELDKGDYTGVKKDNLSIEELERIKNFSISDKYPNGEAMIDLYERIKEYAKNLEGIDKTLLVTHRGVINMFYYLLNNIQLSMDKEQFKVTHGSIHEMDLNKKLIRRIY